MLKFYIPLLLLFALVAGCKDDSTGPVTDPPANEIWIQGNSFRPVTITVPVGTTITWVNKDAVAHTVTSGSGNPSGLFDSGNLGKDQSFSFTFTTSEIITYYCKLHLNMTGSVTVQ